MVLKKRWALRKRPNATTPENKNPDRSIWVAIVSVIGVTISSILNGAFQHDTSNAQIIKDVRVLQLNSLEQHERLVREKYESLSVALSEFMAPIKAMNDVEFSPDKKNLVRA